MPISLKLEGPEIAMYKQAEKSHPTLLIRVRPAMTATIRKLACHQGPTIAEVAVETLVCYIGQNPASLEESDACKEYCS
jgi:hypothetical protein